MKKYRCVSCGKKIKMPAICKKCGEKNKRRLEERELINKELRRRAILASDLLGLVNP